MSTIINATTTNGVVIQPDNSGSLVLQTNSGTTALTIDTSQNVGIGTSSFALSAAGRGDLEIAGSSTAVVGLKGGSNQAYVFNDGTNVYVANASASGNIVFQPATNTERMRIDSSGRVGINTASPTAMLHINSDSDSITPARFNVTTAGATSKNCVIFQREGVNVGFITVTNAATAYVTSSDYRLKENIVPMTGALDKVAQLNPVTYKWKIDGSDGQGFIAHELQEIVPDCVYGEKDAIDTEGNPEYQGVDTSFLVATLTAAIQEQQTIINDLKARVETLEAK
jgi:hypothetical protein